MKRGDIRRKEKKFTIRMQKKLVVLFGIQLIRISSEDEESYKKQILEQQEYSSKTLPARRGDILDNTGTPLAVSKKIYNLVIDSKVIMSKEDYFEPTMKALEACFELNMNEIRGFVKEHSTSLIMCL